MIQFIQIQQIQFLVKQTQIPLYSSLQDTPDIFIQMETETEMA